MGVLLAGAASTMAATANAQEATPAPQPADAQSGQAVADNRPDIVVTAQKRSERLQDVPIQVSVLTADAIAARQINMTTDIVRTVPNLTIEKTDTYSNSVIVLRGISQAANADMPVAVVVDGVPQDDPKQFNMHLFDINQIEVLKGPQGSLYGRNAEAGAIIITTTPPTNEFHGYANVSYGRGNTLDASAGISGPIVPDKILFRLAGSIYTSDGLIRNTFTGTMDDKVKHDWSIRGSLLFNLTDRAKLTLTGQYQDFNAAGVYFAPVFSGNPNDFVNPQGNFPNRGDGTTLNLTGKFDYDLGFATFTSITGYTRLKQLQVTDVDFTNPDEQASNPFTLPFQAGDYQPFSNKIFSQEVRLVGATGSRLRWLLSGNYLHSNQFINTHLFLDTGHPDTDPTNPALILTQNPADYLRWNLGVSGQLDYDITDKLTLTAGARYDSDTRHQIDQLTGGKRRARFSAFQPKVSAAYKFDSSKLVYLTFAQGFRSGGFNPPSYRVPIYRDEKLTNYEVGFKTQFFDRVLTVNGALFHSIVDNLQFSAIDFSTGSQVTSNIDRVRVNGAELEVRVAPTKSFDVFGNLGYSDPKIRKYSPNPAYVGNLIPRANKLSINAGFDYSHSVGDGIELFIRGDMQHYSSKYWYVDNADIQRPKTYVNGSIGAKLGNVTATVWGKNIFNVRAYDTYFPGQQTGLPFDVGYPNRPATYGVSLAARF